MGLPAALPMGDPEDKLLNCVIMTDESILETHMDPFLSVFSKYLQLEA